MLLLSSGEHLTIYGWLWSYSKTEMFTKKYWCQGIPSY